MFTHYHLYTYDGYYHVVCDPPAELPEMPEDLKVSLATPDTPLTKLEQRLLRYVGVDGLRARLTDKTIQKAAIQSYQKLEKIDTAIYGQTFPELGKLVSIERGGDDIIVAFEGAKIIINDTGVLQEVQISKKDIFDTG